MPIRRIRFSLIFAVTTTRICTPERSTRHHCLASTRTGRSLTGLHALLRVPWGIGDRLEPRPFSGPSLSANELLRFLLRIAASKLTFLLFSRNDTLHFNT